ncbi:MAG: GAF domain-containing protein [Candidatus Omnitrophica bacterium]|nr:GAF domain-containing protein [Candidatus Omnitrophota bacterium]
MNNIHDLHLMEVMYIFSSMLTGLGSIALGVFAVIAGKKSSVNIRYFLMSVCVALWSSGLFFCHWFARLPLSLYWNRFGHAAAAFIPVTFFHFILVLVKRTDKKKILLLGYGASFLIALSSFTTLLIRDMRPNAWFTLWPQPGILYPAFILLFGFYAVYSFALGFQRYQMTSGFQREQLKYILVGMVVGFGGGATNYPLFYDLKIPPVGNFFIFSYILMYAYAILRYRLMDVHLAVSRTTLGLGIYTLVFGIPFYAGFVTDSWMFSTSLAVILAIPAPFMYRYFRGRTERILLAEQRHYQRVLLRAASGMVREHNLEKLYRLVVYVVKKAVKIRWVALCIRDDEGGPYRLKNFRNGGGQRPSAEYPAEHPLLRFLDEKREPVVYEELPQGLRRSVDFPEKVGLLIPSFVEDRLLGFLILGEKMNGKAYSADDINVFKILAHQAALSIENCLFFDEFKKVQERIFTAEKLASVGGMADGVAHQIKNRLNHFSVAAGELKYEIQDVREKFPEMCENEPKIAKSLDYLTDIAESLIDNVKRTDGVIRGILSFARTEEKETFFSHFSFTETVELSLELLKIKHQVSHFPLKTNILGGDMIYGVKSQIMEAVYNLLDNAYEAIQDKMNYHLDETQKKEFRPQVRIELAENHEMNKITVSDNGIGIKTVDRNKIFAPFFTTKSSFKSGTGIGMYVVKRMVEENHGGRIWCTSEFMEGTRMHMELPKAPSSENEERA